MSEEAAAAAPADTVLTNNEPESGGDASSNSSSPPGDGSPDNSANPEAPKGQGESGDGGESTKDGEQGDTPVTSDREEVGAPEEYTDFSLENDGSVNEEGMTRFKEFAKEANMPQAQAQETLAYIEKEMPAFLEEVRQQQLDAYMTMTKEWKESYESDPTIGGAKMRETETNAKRALNYINDPDLVALLDSYNPDSNLNGMGLGNHRAIINLLAQYGKTLAEDTHEGGDQHQGGGNASTPEERWYGST